MKNNNMNMNMIMFSCVLIMICLSSINISSEAARVTEAESGGQTSCDYQKQAQGCIPYMSGQGATPSKDCCKQIKGLLASAADQLKSVCTCMKMVAKENPQALTMVNLCQAQNDYSKCNKY